MAEISASSIGGLYTFTILGNSPCVSAGWFWTIRGMSQDMQLPAIISTPGPGVKSRPAVGNAKPTERSVMPPTSAFGTVGPIYAAKATILKVVSGLQV